MKYFINQYGAKSDGSLCTVPIQKAIDDCFLNGGGEVVIPEGTWRIGCIRLRSNVTLHLMENTILEGSRDPEDYFSYLNDTVEPINPSDIDKKTPTCVAEKTNSKSIFPYSRWNNAMIRAINAKNICIIGENGSVIDGKNCYDSQGEENYRGPHAINMWYCENIELKGYTIKDSGNWAHAIQNSKNIKAQNLTVLAGHDGFDVRTCDNVDITDCEFYTGDDCVAGFDNINVSVKNCTFSTACNIVRFGGTDVLIENCKNIYPAKYGFRYNLTDEQKMLGSDCDENCRYNCETLFSYYCDYRAKVRHTPGNIVFKNCSFTGVDSIFWLRNGHVWCCNRSLKGITFENCNIHNVCNPIKIIAPQDEKLTFTMKNCTVSARDGAEDIIFAELENCEEFILENTKLENFKKPQFVCNTPSRITINKI